ncbi:hypothetical protein V8E55_007739 [Tylopilus felleus]
MLSRNKGRAKKYLVGTRMNGLSAVTLLGGQRGEEDDWRYFLTGDRSRFAMGKTGERRSFNRRRKGTACDSDLDFEAGLFSAVNTAFIIAIQPNIVVLNSNNAMVVDIVNAGGLASSPASTTALSYASLSTSLLSAFEQI